MGDAAARIVRAVKTMMGGGQESGAVAHELQHFEAVHVRHVQVEYHQRHGLKAELFDRSSPLAASTRVIGASPKAAWTIRRMVGESSTIRMVFMNRTGRLIGPTRRGRRPTR